MNNRTKGISLAIITAVMWGIMGDVCKRTDRVCVYNF